MSPSLQSASRALRATALAVTFAFFGGLLSVTGGAAPANAADTTIYGQVFLGSPSSSVPAGAGEVLVEYREQLGTYEPSHFVPTAADGTYAISGLALGQYYLRYKYVGSGLYSDMGTRGDVPGYPGWESPVAPSSTVPQNVYLPAFDELDGVVSLGQAGTPAGAGDVVVYYQRIMDNIWGPESAGVPTDASGRYSFGLMPAGIYTFRFEYVGLGSFAGRTWTDGPSEVRQKRAAYFSGASSPFSGDTVLRPPIAISGTVRLSDFHILEPSVAAGAGVSVSYGRSDNGVITPLGSTTTNSAGQYSIPGLVDMYVYVLTFEAPGYFNYRTIGVGGFQHSNSSFTVDATLSRSYTVSGHINLGSVRSAGAGDVVVTFAAANHSSFGGSAATDSNGNYSISGLPGMYYAVSLDYTGADDFTDYKPVFPVASGETVGGWRPSPGRTKVSFAVPGGNRLSGSVYDPSHIPLANATVTLYEVTPFGPSYSLDVWGTAQSGADGSYSFAGIPDGYYGVSFQLAPYAYQLWPGWSGYYAPGVIELRGGAREIGMDATLQFPGSIRGRVSSSMLSSMDYSTHRVSATLLVQDEETGVWVYADTAYMDGGGNYSFPGLAPDQYKVRLGYTGPQGIAHTLSAPVAVAASQTTLFNGVLAPTPQLTPGNLVRGTGPTTYLVNYSSGALVPLRNLASVSDAGFPAPVRTIAQAQIDNYVIADTPLSNLITCGGSEIYLAAEGKLWPIDYQLVEDVELTYLNGAACSGLTVGASVIDTAVLLSSSDGTTYYISADASKHRILTPSTLAVLTAPKPPRVYRVNDAFLESLFTDVSILPPGKIVKGPSSQVYFVAGFNRLVPIFSFDQTTDLGLSPTVITVSQADLDQAVKEPVSTPLRNVIVCATKTYVASQGKLWPVDAALVAGLPKTTLDASACSVLPKATTTIRGALLVTATTGGPVYSIRSDGSKRELLSVSTQTTLAAPYAPVVLKVASSFLTSRPTGLAMLPPGKIVKGPYSRTYFVAGYTHLVPMFSFDQTTDMGLPTAVITVSQAVLDQAVKDPDTAQLRNTVVCGGKTYFASQGKLWPVDSPLVAGLPRTMLDASSCYLLPKATTTIRGALLVQAIAGGPVYSITATGAKRELATVSTQATLSAPYAPVVLKVASSFLSSRPTGATVVPPGSLVKTATSGQVYFVDGFNRRIPVRTWSSVTSAGINTTIRTVSQASLDVLVMDAAPAVPLGIFINCGGQHFEAGGGQYQYRATAGGGELTLQPSTCSQLKRVGMPTF